MLNNELTYSNIPTTAHDVVSSCHVLLETTDTVMSVDKPSHRAVLDNLSRELQLQGKHFTIVEEDVKKLEHFAEGPDEERRNLALAALEFLHENEDRVVVHSLNEVGLSRADALIHFVRELLDSGRNVCVLTADRALSQAIASLSHGPNTQDAAVFKIDNAGKIRRYIPFTSMQTAQPITNRGFAFNNEPVQAVTANQAAPSVLHTKPVAPFSTFEEQTGENYDTGDTVRSTYGKLILGDSISSGAEGTVYRIEGDTRYVIKILSVVSKMTEQRLSALEKLNPHIKSAVLPEGLIYDEYGKTIGYIMPFVDGISLTSLFAPRTQWKLAPEFDRASYTAIGLSILKAAEELHRRGILLSDISPSNVLVCRDGTGKANPEDVRLIDLEGCQFEDGRYTFPAKGITKQYAAPEQLIAGVEATTIRTPASENFSLTLLIAQCLLMGVHPFQSVVSDDVSLKIEDRIMAKAFPYGSSAERRQAQAPESCQYIWSYLSKGLKNFLQDTLCAEPDKRKPLSELVPLLEQYLVCLKSPDSLRMWPELLSLNPGSYKPYITACSECGCEFDVANTGTGLFDQGIYLCNACSTKSVGICERCGKPSTPLIKYKRTRKYNRFCPDCYRLNQNPKPAPVPASAPVSTPVAKPAPQPAFRPSPSPAPKPAPQPAPKPVSEPDSLKKKIREWLFG